MRGDCSIRVSGIGFSRDEIAACAARKGLLSIELDLSSPGPCRCAACRQAPANSRAVLSFQEIGDLLHQARKEGARRCFLADSDPPSHPELRRIIDAARELGMEVELLACGAAIDGAMAGFLRQRDVSVVLKFDWLHHSIGGADFPPPLVLRGRVGEGVRSEQIINVGNACGQAPPPQSSPGVPGEEEEGPRDREFRTALANLKESGYCQGSRPALAAEISISNQTLPEIPELWRWMRSQAIEPYVQIITPRDGQAATIVHPDQAKSLFEELARIDREEFGRKWDKPAALIGRSCGRHLFACHVTPCGTVFACVGVTIPLGNVRTEPLHEILELSEVLENLRAFPDKVKEPCRTCCKTTDCYGCRGAAYQLTGDYLAGDQMCWKAKGAEIEMLPIGVAGLVPHGKSMRMLDQLTKVGERNAQTTFSVTKDCILVDGSGRLDELAFIEMIAQSFAACHGFHLSLDDRPRQRGLLLGVKELVVSERARVGDRLTVHLRKVTRFGDFGVIEGDIFRDDGKLLASGQVKIWRPGEEVMAAMSV